MNFASIRYAYNCQVTYEYYDKGSIHSATMIIRTYAQSELEALNNIISNLDTIIDDDYDVRGVVLLDNINDDFDEEV